MQVAIGFLHRLSYFTVDRCDPLDGMENAVEFHCQSQYDPAIAANDALLRGVDDQQVNSFFALKGCAHDLGRAPHHADQPIDWIILFQTPAFPYCRARASQLPGEQICGPHPAQHLVPVGPGTGRKKSGRLAQTVTDDCVWLQSELGHHVADQTADPHVPENHCLVIKISGWAVLPEATIGKLAAE